MEFETAFGLLHFVVSSQLLWSNVRCTMMFTAELAKYRGIRLTLQQT